MVVYIFLAVSQQSQMAWLIMLISTWYVIHTVLAFRSQAGVVKGDYLQVAAQLWTQKVDLKMTAIDDLSLLASTAFRSIAYDGIETCGSQQRS